MKISIIIPTLNRPDLLKRCIGSFAVQKIDSINYELIVALDKNDTQTKTSEFKNKSVTFIRAHYPGVSAARNSAIGLARGEIVFFIDDDCVIPDEYWLARVLGSFKKYKNAAAIGGSIITGNERGRRLFLHNSLANYCLKQNRRNDNRAAILLGGMTGYRREAFEKYGLFDKNIGYGSAETEMNERIVKGGGGMYLLDNLSLLHLPSRQPLFSYFTKAFLQGRGIAYSFRKNGKFQTNRASSPYFVEVVKNLEGTIWDKIIAYLFLSILSFFYWLGLRL